MKTLLSGVIGGQSEVMGSAWHVAAAQRLSMAPKVRIIDVEWRR